MENKSQKSTGRKFPLPPKKKKNTGWKKWVALIWLCFIGFIVGVAALFYSVSAGLLGDMPDVTELENPDIYVASEIYSSDGELLGKFEKEKTRPVTFQDLPPHLIYALYAKEDERFREHSGIDLQSILRAVYYRGGRGGGSTITQQLAKLLFTQTPSKKPIDRIKQKLKEWVVAVSLERRYTKEEIITLYFNKFDFLRGGQGIEMASRVYFNKSAKNLTLPEAATFVAMLELPYGNNPKSNPERAIKRRNKVLEKMLETQYINQEVYDKAIATPLELDFTPIKKISEGHSAYYKFFLKKEVAEHIEAYEKKTGKKVNLYKDGLKIYVTLDSRMQKYAEEAIEEHMKSLQKMFFNEQKRNRKAPFYHISDKTIDNIMLSAMRRTGRYKSLKAEGMPEDSIIMEFKKPVETTRFTWDGEEDVVMSPWDSIRYHKHIAQAGLMSMDPNSGQIKAWVGGINWEYFKYDHIKQGKRQVGSTFKPFVYAAAIMNLGMNPCSEISNATYRKGGWTVLGGGGMMKMKDGLAHSKNPIAARLIEKTGVDNVIQLARELGVTSDLPRNNTIALGSSDITIYEMLGAYSTFANFGNYVKPEMIWRIEDANGRVIKEMKSEYKEVMNEKYAYTMIEMMKGVAQYGTASGELRRRGIGRDVEIAAKTGTTNDNSDGWFIGITPRLATGVWVGWEDRAAHFYSTGIGQGAKMALPIWAIYMKKVWANKDLEVSKDDKFVEPAGWNGGCDEMRGITGDDTGGLMTLDEIKNPKRAAPKQTDNESSPKPKEEVKANQELNRDDGIDFNQ